MTTSQSASPVGTDHVRTLPTSEGLHDVEFFAEGAELAFAEDVAFVCTAGSHLFGTAGDDSDVDLKGVWVEPLDAIILGEDDEQRRYRTAETADVEHPTSGAGDVDVTLYELRTFVRLALGGDPAAVEMLFVPDSLRHVESDVWREIRELRDRLLSAELTGFADYCRSKARAYADDAARYDAIESVHDTLEPADGDAALRSVVDRVPRDSEYVEVVDQPIQGQDDPVELLCVVDKMYEIDAPVARAVDSLRSMLASRKTSKDDTETATDRKGLYHASRIAWELRELRATGELDLPLACADYLRQLRAGDIPLDEARDDLAELVDGALDTPSDLPDEPDRDFWREWLADFYRTR